MATCKASSKTEILNVKSYSPDYAVGKIVLADKTIKSEDDYTKIDTNNPPVGIICCYMYGVPKMIALHTSDSGLEWARNGNDNWESIKSVYPEDTKNTATNYPAFHWITQYSRTYSSQLAGKIFDWYMPSLTELCEVYKNREIIDASLAKIHSLDPKYANASLGTVWYWSSAQRSYYYNDACYVYFGSGCVDFNDKGDINWVCCIADF